MAKKTFNLTDALDIAAEEAPSPEVKKEPVRIKQEEPAVPEKKDADKQLRYYSGKTEMIGRVLNLLRGDLKEESEEDSITVRKSRNPFGFLDEDPEENDEVLEDKNIDSVAELFKISVQSCRKYRYFHRTAPPFCRQNQR